MEITWLGHSCFRIRGSQAVIITDPYPPSLGYAMGKQTARIVTVSHIHPSHAYVDAISGEFKLIRGPGEYEIGGILILGLATFHDAENGASCGRRTCSSAMRKPWDGPRPCCSPPDGRAALDRRPV